MRDSREARVLRVLIVDDDHEQLDMVSRILRLEGFEVATTSEAIGVSNLVRSFEPDVVLLDVEIPALRGDRLLGLARRGAPAHTKFVLFSAYEPEKLRAIAREVQAHDWISKGDGAFSLGLRLRQMCQRSKGS
jgi:two-component system OmpR family response regulator